MAHRVAVDTLNELAKLKSDEVIVEIGKIENKSINMTVKRFLSTKDFNRFISEIKNSQFADDNEFKPQLNSIVFDIALCEYYTNLNLPDEIEKAYEMVQRLDLKEKIMDVIGCTGQYADLIDCINKAHEFVKAEKTGINGLLGALKNVMEGFDMKEILETLKGFDLEKLEMLPEIKELANVFTALQSPNNQDIDASSVAHNEQPNDIIKFPVDCHVGGV